MPDIFPPQPRRLSTAKAADYLGLSPSFLAHSRPKGDGPVFSKCGARIVYDTRDLDAWLDAHKRTRIAA